MVELASRAGPVDARHAGTPVAAALPATPCHRAVLRVADDAATAMGEALGVDLSAPIGRSTTRNLRSALRLGPDEWLLIDEERPIGRAGEGAPVHSLVDVSHRNVGILVTGARCVDALEQGCPRDLSLEAFPVGSCCRTLLGKCEIVLWRGKDDAFRVEVWRSFAPYALDFLAEACRDASLG